MAADTDDVSARYLLWATVIAVLVIALAIIGFYMVRRYGLTVQAGVYEAVLVLLTIASLTDLRSRTVPTWIVIAMLLLWVATVWFIPCIRMPGAVGNAFVSFVGLGTTAVALDGLMGGLAIGGGMLLLAIVVEAFLGRSSFGGGDIKLLFVVGLFLGLPASLTMLLMACLIAVILTFLVRFVFPEGLAGHEVEEPFIKMTIPFAPSIAIATALLLTLGPLSLF